MSAETRQRASRLAWFAGGAAAAIIAAYRLYEWVTVAAGDLRGPDFLSFYSAARLVAGQGGAHLYQAATQKQFQDQVTSAWPGHFILLPYLHPPYYTLVIAPLAALPFHPAYLALGAVNVVLLALTISVLGRANGLGRMRTAVAAALVVAFLPVFVVLVQGQSDLFVLLPLSLCFLFWVRGRQGWAGVCAGLAVAKPQLLLLLPVLFLARRAWSALAGYVGAVSALVLSSLPMFGIAGWLQYIGVIAPWVVAGDRNFPISGQTIYSLRGLLEAGPAGRPVAVAMLSVAALAAVAIVASRTSRPRLDLAFAVAASLVLSPYQNLHDLSLLVVPGMAIAGAAQAGELRQPRVGLAILLMAYLAINLTVLAGAPAAALAAVALAMYLGWERLARDSAAGAIETPAR